MSYLRYLAELQFHEQTRYMSSEGEQYEYILVGLTGSIGAGKSEVGKIIEEAGIPVLHADRIAKELMTGDAEMKEAIMAEFGQQAYHEGGLNRKYLAEQIFGDKQKLERMNAIVHPRTIAEQGVRAWELVQKGNKIVVCESALIFETGGEVRFDYIIAVDAEPELRYGRAAKRDGVTVEEVKRRDEMQIPARTKVENADFVIYNNGDERELRAKTQLILAILKGLPSRERLDVLSEAEPEEDDEN